MISIQHSQDSQEQKPQTHRSSDMTTDLTQTLTLQFISETNEPQQVKIEDLQKSLTSEIPSYDIINEYSRLFTISIEPTYLISYQNFKNQKKCNEEQLGVGGNGQVFLCTDLGTLELHAVKVVTDINFENVSLILYECINQSLLMAFSKEMILNIVNEILIRVVNSKVDFQIPLELAEFSLYEYIQSNEINEEIYYQLTNILIEFLILLHKNNYAHRDIKPQNILYVKDVGWKLADFGESIKYDVSQGMHKIKGTLAFIPQDVRKHFKQNREILQDLFRNDVYATVCTIVMIKNPQFKSQELQAFMLDNQLDATCQRLLNISKLEELYQLKQEKLSKFQYYGKLVNRKDELVFYDVKVIIQLYSRLHKTLDPKIIQIIDTELGKLKDNNKIVDYNKVVLQLLQYYPFQTDKFKNIDDEFDPNIVLRNPQQYFPNIIELFQFYFGRGLHQQLINFSQKNSQSDSLDSIFMRLYSQILYGYQDEAKVQLNILANKLYSETSQVNSYFLGFYNQLYYILNNEFPIINCEQTQDLQEHQLMKELKNFSMKDLDQQDIQDYLNMKNFKTGGQLNLLALLHPLQPNFIRFRNQQIFDHILYHLGCNSIQIQENRQLLSQLIKEHLQSNNSHQKNLQLILLGCIILYSHYCLFPELLDFLVYFEKILILLGPGLHHLELSVEIQRLMIKYNIYVDYKLQSYNKYTIIFDKSNLYDSLYYVIQKSICSFQSKLIEQQFKNRAINKFKLTFTQELLTCLMLAQYQKINKQKLIDQQSILSNCIYQYKPKYQQIFLKATIIVFQQSNRKELFIKHLYVLRQYQRIRNNFNFNEDQDYESDSLLTIFSGILLKYYNLYKILKIYPTLAGLLLTECYYNNQKLFQNYKQHLNAFKICLRVKRFMPLHNEDLKQMYLSKS